MRRFPTRPAVEALETRETPSTLSPLSAVHGLPRVHAAAARGHVSVRETVPRLFNAQLSGRAEVPASPSRATGSAILLVDKAGAAIRYAIDITKVNNIASIQLFLGAAGTNGPAVATLYRPSALGQAPNHGRLPRGLLTAGSLVGPLQGASIADLAAQIRAGNVYMSIATDDGVPPVESTPGDLPTGEIRGQLRSVK